jgi:hypothetical protein
MGIMDVNIPLLYGEGEERAFLRLQEEVLRTTDDQTIFAWTAPDATEWTWTGLLAPSPDMFASCADMMRVHSHRNSDCQMTPRGIRITLPVHPVTKDLLKHGEETDERHGSADEYLVTLNCRAERTSGEFCSRVRIMRIYNDEFVRINCFSTYPAPIKRNEDRLLRKIIVTQNLRRAQWPRWQCGRIGGVTLSSPRHLLTVTEHRPVELWDSSNLAWKLQETDIQAISCVISLDDGDKLKFQATFDRSQPNHLRQLKSEIDPHEDAPNQTTADKTRNRDLVIGRQTLIWDDFLGCSLIWVYLDSSHGANDVTQKKRSFKRYLRDLFYVSI